jgi:flagellar export protein FliJ
MLKARRKRFEKLLNLRQRELDQKRAESTRAVSAMRDARVTLEAAQKNLHHTANDWRVPQGGARRADSFLDAGAWLQSRIKEVERSLRTCDLAKERVRLTNLQVQRAEKAKRQIETLIERLDKEQSIESARVEQKDQDEIATRLSLRRIS